MTRSLLEVLRDHHPSPSHQIAADPARHRSPGANGGEGPARRRFRSPRLTANWRARWSRAPARPTRRLEAVRLAQPAFPGVMFAPIVPALNDREMESVLDAAEQARARWLCAAAPAAGNKRSVPRVAGSPSRRSRQACHGADSFRCVAARITTPSGEPV